MKAIWNKLWSLIKRLRFQSPIILVPKPTKNIAEFHPDLTMARDAGLEE